MSGPPSDHETKSSPPAPPASPWQKGSDEQPAPPPQEEGGSDARPPVDSPWLHGGGEQRERRAAGLDDIFKRGSRGGNAPRPSGSSRLGRTGLLPAALIALVLGSLAATMVHTLAEGETGVVTTMGRYSRQIGPGLSLTAPWPFEQVQAVKTGTVQQTAFPGKDEPALLLTRDQEAINLAYTVRWKVTDVKRFAFENADPDALLRRLATAEVRAIIAETPFDTIWEGSAQGALQDRIRHRLQRLLDAYRAGVSVVGVDITASNPPAPLADAFAKVATAREEMRAEKEKALTWSEQQILAASAEAAEFDKVYVEYREAPQIMRKRMYYETMERVLAANDKVVVPVNGVTVALPAAPAVSPPAAEPEKAK